VSDSQMNTGHPLGIPLPRSTHSFSLVNEKHSAILRELSKTGDVTSLRRLFARQQWPGIADAMLERAETSITIEPAKPLELSPVLCNFLESLG
jgi:hypothetical protein